MQALTPGLATAIRAIFGWGLQHTYARTPTTAVTIDGWAQQAPVPGTVQTGLTCRYIPRTLLTRTDAGYVLATEPPATGGTAAFVETLLVPYDSPLVENDQISDIRDPAGRVLLAGPAWVESVMPHAGFGELTLKVIVLRGQTEERVG